MLLFICSTLILNAKPNENDIDKTAQKVAAEIINSINNSKIPADAKIAITFFNRIDNEKTPFGIHFSNKLFIKLMAARQKGKITQEILFPENIDKYLDEMMYDYFTVPQGQNEGDYWTKLLNNNKPDFYIIGKYKFNSKYTEIQFSELIVKPDNYGKYSKIACVVKKAITGKISDKLLIQEIKKLDYPINKPNLYYEKLIDINDNLEGFNLTIINENTGKPVNDFNFIVGENYSLVLDLKQDLYVYAFFYDPNDYNTEFMTMAFPYDENSKNNTFMKKGKHKIPGEGLDFEIEAPFSPVYIKIFALKKKPNIDFDFKKIDDYYITVFNYENCRKFVEQIEKLNKNEIFSRSLNFSRSRK